MNEYPESQPLAADLPRWIDRLVDGELSNLEQRQLLVALEAEPEGWRRCALAFVEAQSWRQELRCISQEAEPAPTHPASSRLPATAAPAATNRKLHWFLMAACTLLAFALGVGTRELWLGQNQSGKIANRPSTITSHELSLANAASNINPSTALENPTPWQALKITIPSADGQSDQVLEVPLVEGNEQKLQSLLANQPAVLSDVTRQTLESTGHEVAEHRALYPVKLDDGRQAVLPMDYVEVRFNGGWQ